MTTADRVEFYRRASERLKSLANRIGAADKKKIVAALRAKIPPVTDDDIRTVKRENAEADRRVWDALQGMNAEQAAGHKELAAAASRKAAEAETQSKHAAEKVAAAKDRLDRLAKGEDVPGGLGKPLTREDYEKILRDAGWSRDDINFSAALHGICGDRKDVFDDFVKQSCELHRRREKSDRWKVLRGIIRSRP